MVHSTWAGAPYDAGLRAGRAMARNGADPFGFLPADGTREEFARACLPLYKAHAPWLLEETRGVADGLCVPFERVAGFLWGMYCFEPAVFCSCFAYTWRGNTVLGRNSDFSVKTEPFCDSPLYRLDGCHAFLGNTTAWTEMEDGVNETGLAAGLTFVCPTRTAPGLNAGMLLRVLLDRCETVGQAVAALGRLPRASAQTLTLADRTGDVAVAECDCGSLAVRRPRAGEAAVYAANDFQEPGLRPRQRALPDGIFSHTRYETMRAAFESPGPFDLAFARELLGGKRGFLCQYDRAKGMDTVWSSLYDLTGGETFRAEGNPSRVPFARDTRLMDGP